MREPSSEDRIAWGAVNVPMEPEHFEVLRADVIEYLAGPVETVTTTVPVGSDGTVALTIPGVGDGDAWQVTITPV